MHEYAIVDAYVQELLRRTERDGLHQVTAVRFRRGSAFSEDALRQAFTMLTAGTPLENAALDVATVNLDFQCPCGHRQVINSDDLIGHMFICPNCGAIKEIDEAHDLELIEVIAQAA